MSQWLDERIKLFETVRDIPYFLGDEKTNASCWAKAKMLGKLLGSLGLDCRLVSCKFFLADTNISKDIVEQAPHPDAKHIFLKVFIPETGKWTIVDATWDRELSRAMKINNWDGISDTEIGVIATDIDYLKDEAGNFISCDDFEVRNFDPEEKFTASLNSWFKNNRDK